MTRATTGITIAPDVLERVQLAAATEGRSRSNMIERLCVEALEARDALERSRARPSAGAPPSPADPSGPSHDAPGPQDTAEGGCATSGSLPRRRRRAARQKPRTFAHTPGERESGG